MNLHTNPSRLTTEAVSAAVPLAKDGHVVLFFERTEVLVDAVTDYLAEGLAIAQPCVVIAIEERRELFVQRLRAKGLDVDALVAAEQLLLLDAHDALQSIMMVHSPSPQRFTAAIGGAIARLSRSNGNATVRAYGEMVDVLWRAGNTVGALRLEELWNDLTRTHDFRLFCAYAMGQFYKAGSIESLAAICERHSHVRPLEPCNPSDPADRRAIVTELSERVIQLEQVLRNRESRQRELQAALRRLAVEPKA